MRCGGARAGSRPGVRGRSPRTPSGSSPNRRRDAPPDCSIGCLAAALIDASMMAASWLKA